LVWFKYTRAFSRVRDPTLTPFNTICTIVFPFTVEDKL
jgi:hypothetical protein